jgi:hypothetical protein
MWLRYIDFNCQFVTLAQVVRDFARHLGSVGPGLHLIVALKPENMHLFYPTWEIAVLATSEAILLIVQIPLRTEIWTYMVYNPVP